MIHADPKRLSKADHLLTVGKAHINEKGPQRRGPPASFSRRTLSAAETFILWRYKGPCNTDDAEVYLDAVLPLAIQVQNEAGWEDWARLKTLELLPKLKEMDEDLWADHVREASKRKGVSVDKIAKLLHIREAELDACFQTKRHRCGLVSIDRPKRVRTKERKEYQAAWKRVRRQCKPRADYQAKS